jgi:hypothetical protein
MKEQESQTEAGRSAVGGTGDMQPLLAALISTANRRGHKLGHLAKELGVTYERLGQWRRRPAEIATAGVDVYDRASKYLGVPTALAMVMGGQIRLNHFVWPTTSPLADRVVRELERLRQDALLGAFVPDGLFNASPDIQIFVLFLYRQIYGQDAKDGMGLPWLSALHQAVIGASVLHRTSDGMPNRASGGDMVF